MPMTMHATTARMRGFFITVAAAVFCSACAPDATGPANRPNQGPIEVVTDTAVIRPLGLEIEAVGTARANESAEVTSKVSNQITAIRFQEGSFVKAGEVLVEKLDIDVPCRSQGPGGAFQHELLETLDIDLQQVDGTQISGQIVQRGHLHRDPVAIGRDEVHVVGPPLGNADGAGGGSHGAVVDMDVAETVQPHVLFQEAGDGRIRLHRMDPA